MHTSLQQLLDEARRRPQTPGDLRRQASSFAYGNLKIENPAVTPRQIVRASRQLARQQAAAA